MFWITRHTQQEMLAIWQWNQKHASHIGNMLKSPGVLGIFPSELSESLLTHWARVHVLTCLLGWTHRVPRRQDLFRVNHFSEEGESGGIKKEECAFKIKSAICVRALCVTVCVCVIYYSHRCVFFRRGTKDYSASTIQLQLSTSHNTIFTHPTHCSASVFPSMPHPVSFSPTFPPPLLLPVVFASPCLLLLLHLLLAFNPRLFPRCSFTSLDSKKLLILYSLYRTCWFAHYAASVQF